MAVLLLFTIAMPLTANAAFATTNVSAPNSSPVTPTAGQSSGNLTNGSNQATNTPTTTAAPATTPTTDKVNSSANLAAGSPQGATTVSPQVSFTSDQINSASSKVKSFVETNHRLPSYVTINNYQVGMPQFLELMAENLLNINSGLKTSVTLKTVNSPSNPTETVKTGNILQSEYQSLAQSIKSAVTSTGSAPNYISSSLGQIRFESLVYTFSKILNYQATNQRLPSYVSVTPWTTQNGTTPSEGGSGILRPVYIVSDNINGLSTDTARINAIISALAKLGIKAYNYGIGPQTHLTVLSNSNVPKNALIVEIAGGADAGAIYEKESTWYKNLLGTKKDFIAFTSGATKITGLAWLPRAHDDNYDPASFTGIAHPDQVLLNNGYHYFEGLTSTNIAQLAQAIYNVATS